MCVICYTPNIYFIYSSPNGQRLWHVHGMTSVPHTMRWPFDPGVAPICRAFIVIQGQVAQVEAVVKSAAPKARASGHKTLMLILGGHRKSPEV